MKPSIIISSYGAGPKLSSSLNGLDLDGLVVTSGEVVLVYSEGDLSTCAIMEAFAAQTASVPVKVHCAKRRGLSVARNVGIQNANGELLIFTDDDCCMISGYIEKVTAEMETGGYDYGGGGVRDIQCFGSDRPHITGKFVIGPHTLVGAGVVNGNNMFFRREVFTKLGGFREDMGASSGRRFIGAEDLEMTTRASLAGMTGILIGDAIIVHNHQRTPNEIKEIHKIYDLARGSFYAYLIARGVSEAWSFWGSFARPDDHRKMSRAKLEILQREFFGASEYLRYILDDNVDY